MWKNDLAKRCHTPAALTDHSTGMPWNCDKNTLDDFYDYLRGTDGKDGKDGKDGNEGKDGKPGEPGTPGVEVTIVRGIPNVIAQYSQPEYGEYVRTTDGGVLYKVYDEEGNLAPNAKVKGMPGVNPTKVYVADNKGEFVIPKEDLPEVQDLNQRWGVVKEVTLQGKAPRISARNTYVPNRVRMRMVLYGDNNPLQDKQILNFYIQRRLNPEDKWQNLPSYLPSSKERGLVAYRVIDKNKASSILKNGMLTSKVSTIEHSGASYVYRIETYRFMKENSIDFKNEQQTFWKDADIYYTVKAKDSYYGEEFQWNGVCLLAPYQIGPTLKSLKLKSVTDEAQPSFLSAEGELDFSQIDFKQIYKSVAVRTVRPDGMDMVLPEAYPEMKLANLNWLMSGSCSSRVPAIGRLRVSSMLHRPKIRPLRCSRHT